MWMILRASEFGFYLFGDKKGCKSSLGLGNDENILVRVGNARRMSHACWLKTNLPQWLLTCSQERRGYS